MHQVELNTVHAKICELIAAYTKGLMMTPEFVLELNSIPTLPTDFLYDDVAGLIDPNTGLRIRALAVFCK